MKRTETHSSQNGYHKASPQPGEVFVVPPQPTTFPSETIPLSLPLLFYNLARFTWGDVRLIRLLQWALVFAAAFWATGWLPGRWWGTALSLALLVALFWRLYRWRQADFVTFVRSPLPPVTPQRLAPKEKLPVYVTGRFAVEKKIQRFTWLPGFYRTFATREHALICQVAQRSWFWLARWPEAEIGLWYIFFTPPMIKQLEWGELHFGKHYRPALAVTYELPVDSKQRRRTEVSETVYLALPDADNGCAILADLLVDLPAPALGAQRPSSLHSQ